MEAIRKVDTSEKNTRGGLSDHLVVEFGYSSTCEFDWKKVETRLKYHYLHTWMCTDSAVGVRVYALDGEAVAISTQVGRKCDEDFQFLSQEAWDKIRVMLSECLHPQSKENITLLDPNANIFEADSVDFTSQLMDEDGLYEGEPCTVVREKTRTLMRADYLCKLVAVIFADGREAVIPIKDFLIPLRLDPNK
jgi:hypothetical protein